MINDTQAYQKYIKATARIKELETENKKLLDMLEDIQSHIENNLIDLSSSGYLALDINKAINSAKEK